MAEEDLMRYASAPNTTGANKLTKFMLTSGISRTRQGAERAALVLIAALILLAAFLLIHVFPHTEPVQNPNDPGWPTPIEPIGA